MFNYNLIAYVSQNLPGPLLSRQALTYVTQSQSCLYKQWTKVVFVKYGES